MTPAAALKPLVHPHRTPLVCHGDRPVCPSCRRPIRRVAPNLGSMFARCERVPRAEGRERRSPCGQHLHILATREDVCLVTAMTRAEYEHLRPLKLDARQVYTQLGVLLPI